MHPHLSLSLCFLPPPPQPSFPRSVQLHWSHPGKPNGIMLGYKVLRRTLRSCTQGGARVTPSSGRDLNNAGVLRFRCSYLQCPLNHSVCGTSCFDPDKQVNIFILCLYLYLYLFRFMTLAFSAFYNIYDCIFCC